MNLSNTTVWKFKHGTILEDSISGFTGVVTARIEYLNGCVQYHLEPKVDEKGKKVEGHYFDEGQLFDPVKEKGEIELQKLEGGKINRNPPGGVMPNCPK